MAAFVSEKVRRERLRSEQVKLVLAKHNQDYVGRSERKLNYEQVLERSPNIRKLEDFWIRDPKEWKSKSFNLNRQVIDFVSWVLCEYSVPSFMFKLFTPYNSNNHRLRSITAHEEVYLDWFVTVAQGMSFRKACKNFMSNKEAALFLTAPKNNSIAGNILWSKCKAHKVSDNVTNALCGYWESRFNSRNRDWWDNVVDFFSRYPDTDQHTLQDVMDFIYDMMNRDSTFTLAGRTLRSVIELTNRWHKAAQAVRGCGFVDWEGLDIRNWKYDVKEMVDFWTITQITDSKKLFHEGAVMHHCVGSYVRSCVAGFCGIFTLEHKYDGHVYKCLTIEVNKDYRIVQVRGKFNRSADKTEQNILKRWAADRGLTFGWGIN